MLARALGSIVVLRRLEKSLDNAEQNAVPETPWLMVEEGIRRLKEVGMAEWMDILCEVRKFIRRLCWVGGSRGPTV